jgi:hypothetical protein
MSCAKQLPRTRSFYVVEFGSNAPAPGGTGGIRSSRRAIPAMVTWLTLETLARFTRDVICALAEAAIAGLSWLFSEFLAGCAIYAEAMYPAPMTAMGHSDNPTDQAVPAPAPVVARPRLFVISDTTRSTPEGDLPKQAGATGQIAARDRTPWKPEIVRSVRAPAPRRKNRPR